MSDNYEDIIARLRESTKMTLSHMSTLSEAAAALEKERARAEAAEAEVARLREALTWIWENAGDLPVSETARKALEKP